MTDGTGVFYDGITSQRHDVTVTLLETTLRATDAQRRVVAEWPYDELESMAAPDSVLRLGRRDNPDTARLEVRDPGLMTAIDIKAEGIDRTGGLARRQRAVVTAWIVAATVSLVLVAWFGVPVIAERLAPLVPAGLERRLGDAVDMQTRAMLDTGGTGEAFECGRSPRERPGRAAFDKLVARLETNAGLVNPVRAFVVRRPEANAIALPGGTVYVFEGLIDQARTPDELAGVIAHEMGHVAHRDGTRSVLQGAGLSFLFGMLLGDFVGGGAVVIAARTVLQSSYTREVETAADAYSVDLMNSIGADGSALAAILTRIGGATEPGMKILMDHPETRQRAGTIRARAQPAHGAPLLDATDWAALKRICER
jgi:Zn-dependent protease with chaperone function